MIIYKKFYYFNNIENHLEYFKYLSQNYCENRVKSLF